MSHIPGGPVLVFIQPDQSVKGEADLPPTPPANTAKWFIRANSYGKTQFCVMFDDGTYDVLATQG